jgi:alcohol dehydrogenase class IV
MNRKAIKDRIAMAAAYLGIKRGFSGFYDHVLKMREELAIPATLSAMKTDVKIDNSRFDEMTKMALKDPSAGGNPVKMTKANTRKLFDACL